MSIVKIHNLVKVFLKFPLSHIPILDQNSGGDTYLIGFLSRQKVYHYSTDKIRLEKTFDKIPDFLITKEILPENIWEFFEKAPIPVYDIFGRNLETWDRKKINYYLKNFIFTIQYPDDLSNPVVSEDESKCQLLEILVSSIPFPLFAMDTKGNHIFYNEIFIKEILEKGPFKKTLAMAEAFFKELIQNTIAENVMKNFNTDVISVYLDDFKKKLLIVNLTQENDIIGYLCIFLSGESFSMKEDINFPVESMSSSSLNFIEEMEQKLKKGKNYDELIEDLEIQIINRFLRKNRNNISHTAEELKIKRTTLQNKIKRLGIQTTILELENSKASPKKTSTKKSTGRTSKKAKKKKSVKRKS